MSGPAGQAHGARQPDEPQPHPAHELAASLRDACASALYGAGGLVRELRRRAAQPPRGAAFAAVNAPLASASQAAADGAPKKRKKKRSRPVSGGSPTFSGAAESFPAEQPAAPQPAEQAAAGAEPQTKQQGGRGFSLPGLKLPGVGLGGLRLPRFGPRRPREEEAPASVRELDGVPGPRAADAADDCAAQMAHVRRFLTPLQQQAFDTALWNEASKRIQVEVNGSKMSLAKLADRARAEAAAAEMGAGEPTLRKVPREQALARTPAQQLRPDAPKMQLRPEEHEALGLDRFGVGHLCSERRLLGMPWGVVHDWAWGIFGSIPRTQAALQGWAGRNPREVLQRQEFYDDILDNAAQMELTLMMVAERPIPLSRLRNGFLARQIEVMRRVPRAEHTLRDSLAPRHAQLLADIKRTYTEEALQSSGLLDARGCVIPETKFFVTVGPQGQLTAEAVTAGPLRRQRGVQLGQWADPTFSRAVLENFLGLFPLDDAGKHSVGNGALYVANGFDYRPPEQTPQQAKVYVPDAHNDPLAHAPLAVEGVGNAPDLFSLAPAPRLLSGVWRGRRAAAA